MTDINHLRAEVERLTAERDRQYDQNAEQITRIAALEAENEKMQAALERIDRMRAAYEDGRDVLVAKIGVMQDIARAAITQEKRDE